MKNKLNILLITGVITSEHDPKMNAMLRCMLESTGRFRVKITEEFTGATAATLAGYDAVLINYDGKESVEAPYQGWGADTEKVLYEYVQNGGGAVVYHSSVIHGDPALGEEFDRLAGCHLDFRDGARKSPKLAFAIDIDNTAHEITRTSPASFISGCEDFFVNMKWLPDVPVTVLATVYDGLEDYTDPSKIQAHRKAEFDGTDLAALEGINSYVPVAWVHNYGKGRVFSTTIGHGPDTLRRPEFVGLMCRAVEWAACGEVTIPYPDLDNEKRTRCWPYYTPMTIQEFANLTAF